MNRNRQITIRLTKLEKDAIFSAGGGQDWVTCQDWIREAIRDKIRSEIDSEDYKGGVESFVRHARQFLLDHSRP